MKRAFVMVLFFVVCYPVVAFGAGFAGIWGNLQTDPNTAYFVVETGANTSSFAAYYGDAYGKGYEFDVYNATQNGNQVTVKPWWTSKDMEFTCTLDNPVNPTTATCVITRCAPKQQKCGPSEMPGNTAVLYKLL